MSNNYRDAVLIQINKSCEAKDFSKILSLSKEYNMPYFGMFLSTALRRQRVGLKPDDNDGLVKYHNYFTKSIETLDQDDTEITPIETVVTTATTVVEKLPIITEEIRVMLLCNWTTPGDLASEWDKMKPPSTNILLVNENPDYWVIINKPSRSEMNEGGEGVYDPEKTIVFQMEPMMCNHPEMWGEWSVPDPGKFLRVFTHQISYNNIEWHVSIKANQPFFPHLKKDPSLENRVSAVLSSKYFDIGHIRRIDFVKYIEDDIDIDVFGDNAFGYKSFKDVVLPYHKKDDGMFPYKYHFAVENHSINNYFTEKIVDGILSECLTFYHGAPNIGDYIYYRCFIFLPIDDMEESKRIVKEAIANDEWSKRIDDIRKEKHKILTGDMNFFNRIEGVIRK